MFYTKKAVIIGSNDIAYMHSKWLPDNETKIESMYMKSIPLSHEKWNRSFRNGKLTYLVLFGFSWQGQYEFQEEQIIWFTNFIKVFNQSSCWNNENKKCLRLNSNKNVYQGKVTKLFIMSRKRKHVEKLLNPFFSH